MSFNCPKFIEEFKQYVGDLQVKAILEVGSYSGELKNAVGADGIDINPKLPEVEKCDIRDYKTDKLYGLVFSSGLLGHYDNKEAKAIIKAMAKLSKKYVLNYVPNSNCLAYKNAKKKSKAHWKDELDFTEESLAKLHEEAGLEVVETGTLGKNGLEFGELRALFGLLFSNRKVGRENGKQKKKFRCRICDSRRVILTTYKIQGWQRFMTRYDLRGL